MSLGERGSGSDPDSDGSGNSRLSNLSKRHGVYAVAIIAILALMWFLRPLLHPFIHPLIWRSPNILFYIVMTTILTIGGHFVTTKYGYTTGSVVAPFASAAEGVLGRRSIVYRFFDGFRRLIDSNLSVLGPVFFISFVVIIPVVLFMFGFGGGLASIYAHEDVADRMNQRMEVVDYRDSNGQVTDKMPQMNATNARVTPRAVSDRITSSSIKYRTHTLSDSRVMFDEDGTPMWSYPVEPNGLANTLRLPQKGAYVLAMDDPNARPLAHEGQVTYGFGENPLHDWQWKSKKTKYGAEYPDAFPVVHNGKVYTVAPFLTYEWRVGNPLEGRAPIPYAVKRLGGVVLIEPDGDSQVLSPAEAASHPVLEDQNYYPYSLARYEVNSMQWQHGSVNRAFFHEDQLELAEMPAQGNQQPFVVWADRGEPVYYVAAEPWGGGSGVYQIYTFDAQRGTTAEGGVQQFTTPEDVSLLGPSRATGFAMRPPEIKRLTDVEPVEPIPVVRDDGFYWMVRIVPGDSSGISAVVFVDAEDRTVAAKFLNVDTEKDVRAIKAFIRGERDSGRNAPDGGDDGQENVVVTITVSNSDGSVDETVNVTSGQSVVIDTQNGTQTNSTAG